MFCNVFDNELCNRALHMIVDLNSYDCNLLLIVLLVARHVVGIAVQFKGGSNEAQRPIII